MFSALNQIIRPLLSNSSAAQGNSVNPSHNASDRNKKHNDNSAEQHQEKQNKTTDKQATEQKDITTFSVDALRAYILRKDDTKEIKPYVNNNIPNAIQAYIKNDLAINPIIQSPISSKKTGLKKTLTKLDDLEKNGVHHITIHAEETFIEAIDSATLRNIIKK